MSAEDNELILQCIAYGNEELLRELIDANPSNSNFSSLSDANSGGITPLHLAATKGFCGCMKILLSTKCDVDVLSSPQTALKTPLLMASESGNDKAVEILLDAGADIFYTDVNGYSALQLAQMQGHSNTVKVLVSNLDKIHTTSGIMRDEIIQAIIDGDVGTVYRILAEMPKQCRQRITNGNKTDEKSALYLACEHGRTDIVDALMTLPGHIIIYSVSGDNVLHAAVASQNFETVEIILKKFPFLMDAPNNDGNLPLHWACQNGNFEIVKLMLELEYPESETKYFEDNRGIQTYKFICDLNATDFECRTPFYLAVVNGHTSVVHFLVNFKLELFHNDKEPCIENPLAFNIYCSNGRTALMMACANGAEEIVRILLDHEVDVNLPIALTEQEIRQLHPNEEMRCAGSGALVEAAKSGHIRIIKLLLRKGAIDYDNRALTAAVKTGKIDEISIFLNQLAFADNEYRVNKKSAYDSTFPAAVGGSHVLNSSNLLANIFPSTSVQLNWHGAALETLTNEWLTSAALKFNARLRHSRLALTAITRLDLSFNRLTEIPAVIYQLQSLYILDLSQNLIQLIETPPNNSYLPCLENLNLEANYIQTLPALLFSKTCPNLKILNVAGNRLRIVPNFIWTAPKLKEINLSSNEIIEISTVWMQQNSQHQQRRSAKASHQERIESRASRIRSKHSGTSSTSASAAKIKESPRSENIKEHDIIRLNAWQKKIQLSNIDDLDYVDDEVPENLGDIFSNSLRTLNLSSNKLKVMPTCLACCCPKLTRLDLSMNEIISLGPLECLPSSLRHLNLCHNRLIKVFTRAESADLLCQAPSIQAASDSRQQQQQQRPSLGGNRHSRSRSRSVARNQRSLSVVRTSDGERVALSEVCPHKSHCRFEALKTLNLSHNEISQFDLFVPFGFTNDFNSIDQFNLNLKQNSQQMRSYLIFPALTNLDISYNALKSLPATVSLLSSLAALNVSGNRELDSLPYELGLLDKLWNISLKDCPVKEPLKSIVNAENYKTVELIAFLRNKLENSKPYNKLKLLILGGPGVGKTQLLQQIRAEGNVIKKNLQSESWSRRLGHNFTTNAIKALSSKSIQISSGVDVAEWSFEPKKGSKNSPESFGPITFRTWDFDGKMKEYATVCQYFFSRRSIYIVLWKATDGDIALNEIHEWLLFIQSRAPNSTVIIVGTHFDAVEENLQRFPKDYLETLYRSIQERFVNIPDSDKKGLPRVAASLFVSLKSKHNMRSLCNLLYQTAADLKTSGRKQKLLSQKIPSIYLALEVITVTLTDELRAKGSEPIMKFNDFWIYASGRIGEEFGRPFRDISEFRQALLFLHENGVIIYFEDSALGEFCFLDPPWLYSALSSIISTKGGSSNAHENAITTNTDINAIVKQFINHSTTDSSRRSLLKQCIFRLLYRLEAALPCQNKLLIISSALPDEYLLRADYPGAKIKFKTKLSSFHLQWKPPTMTVSMSPTKKPSFFHRKIVRTLANKHFEDKESTSAATVSVPKLKFQQPSIDKKIYVSQHPKKNLRRLFSMQYVPPGFWPRLITRILDDEKVTSAISRLFVVHSSEGTPLSSARRRSSSSSSHHADATITADPSTAYLSELINKDGFEWLLWKSGLEINAFGTFILSIKHFLPLASVRDVNYSMTELQKKTEDGQWRPYKLEQTFLVELLIPNFNVRIQLSDGREFILEQDETVAARLLAVFVNIIDDLLEDWFPALGTRFVHTSEGRLLVDRLIPCPDCAYHERNALKSQKSMDLNNPDIGSPGQFPPKSQTMDNFVVISKSIIYLFTVEECILQARGFSPATKDTNFGTLICPIHEQIPVELMAPEVSFKDLPTDLVLNDDGIKRGKLMGRGAFGFVFSGFVRKKQNEAFNEVALKVLEPVEPGIGAKGSAQAAFEAFMLKWKNDALENCARSYCTARQELNMLTDLHHPHIPTLIGFCARPMTIAVELAPLGALDQILAKYRRVDARLTVDTLQQVCIQIAKAIEYLHTSKIIFRDLKSENVLVWRFPLPRAIGDVRVKLGDYGISRFSYPSGVCKGYGGTEGFMAPEIMRANGEQEYNEKVDCFSFGMFVYELISLKQPYDGQEQMKDFILDGGRPFLSDKELLIPSNVLDLMVTCWSEDPDLRPTAAQLVSLTTAPEFGHLLDVSLLDEHTKAKLGTLVSLPPESLSTTTVSSSGNNSNCWLQKNDSEWILLSCSPFGWLECRTLTLSQQRPRTTAITAICAIDENTIWLADNSGTIRVMSNSTLEELNRFNIIDLEPSFASGDTGIHGIQVFAERQTALITLLHSILICICAGAEKPIFLSSIELAEKIYVTSFLPAVGNWQILTGHDNAKMIVHHINGTKTQLIYSASVTHSSPTKLRTTDFKDATPETAAVKFIVTSRTNTNFVWSSLDGGSSIYFWDNCCLRRTLDCRKILPSSESLSSMSIDSIRDASISALCVLASDYLLLGTTAGLLIVLDGKELMPLAAFRSFSSSIDLILPVLCQSFSLPLNQREPSLQSLNSLSPQDLQDRQKVESDSTSIQSTESGVVNDYLLDAVSKVKSMFVSGKSEKSPTNLFEESYFVVIGYGYRPLIDRFSSAEAISDSESSQKCAVVFRAGDWI